MNPLLYADFYKVHHFFMYPDGMTKLYSNFTPRKSRIKGVDKVVVFGLQHFMNKYLVGKFNKNFFARDRQEIAIEYTRHTGLTNIDHILELHDLGYLPIEIKALEEGSLCPIGVPCLTVTNTHKKFAWLVNYMETLISCQLWQAITSATIAYEYKKLLSKYAVQTTGTDEFVQWQGHDFSMRGMSSVESAILSGMGHLLSFTGTDTIPAIYALESSYQADGLIGASVPATEHSVMCMGTKEEEIETFLRLLNSYISGILSVVSDTWDLWKVCTVFLPKLKDLIELRGLYTHKDGRIFTPYVHYDEDYNVISKGFTDNTDSGMKYGVEWVMTNPDITIVPGKLVIRPDSGDPVRILCGIHGAKGNVFSDYESYYKIHGDSGYSEAEYRGVIELLWNVFGGTVNEYGYKVLDPHIGAIYGDSITLDRAKQICEDLKAKGFASTNVVLGIGSYTYQYNTRDTFGFAMKATYGEITHPKFSGEYVEAREIFKDPITDDGTKRSKKGLLRVGYDETDNPEDKYIIVDDQCTWEEEGQGLLQTVFKDGKIVKTSTLEEVRTKLNSYVAL